MGIVIHPSINRVQHACREGTIFSCAYLNEGIFPYSVSELSAGQVDVLWDCLVCDSESSDDTLEWFLQQAQSKEFHALDVSALQYILAEKVTPLI